MEVGHAFAGVRTVIDDETEAAGKTEFARKRPGGEQEVSEHCLVVGPGLTHAWYRFLRYDQQVNRGLGLNVVEGNADLVFMLNLGRDFAIDDFLEDCLGHGSEGFEKHGRG